MILLDIVVRFEENSILKEIIPQFAATFLAFALGLYSNHWLYKKSKLDQSKKENQDFRLKLLATAENYLLVRTTREECFSLIKTYGILVKFTDGIEKNNYKSLQHEFMLREQDIKLKCHSLHAEMRALAMAIHSSQGERFDLNLVLFSIQSLAQEIQYDFDTWNKIEFYSNEDDSDRLRKEYSDKVNLVLNMHLHSLQEKVNNNQ